MAVSKDEREDSTEHMRVNMANNQRATRAERWFEMTKRAFFLIPTEAALNFTIEPIRLNDHLYHPRKQNIWSFVQPNETSLSKRMEKLYSNTK